MKKRYSPYTPKDDNTLYMPYLREIVAKVYPLADAGRSKYVSTRQVYRLVGKYWRHKEIPFELVSVQSVGIALANLGLRRRATVYDREDKAMCGGWSSKKTLGRFANPASLE